MSTLHSSSPIDYVDRIYLCLSFLILYTSGFKVVPAQSRANVEAISNVVANWTWFPADPIDISFNLFPNVPRICEPGQGFPIGSKGIIAELNRTVPDLNGQKHGVVSFTVNKTGDYILCAYHVVTRTGDNTKDPLRSIANSTVISVVPPSERSGPSGGIIAGAVIAGIFLAGVMVAAFERMAIQQQRERSRTQNSSFASASMSETGLSGFNAHGQHFAQGRPQHLPTQNMLQPLRRLPD
ncbi:hypothetical protein Moror_3687 [Moniliophthora roreri MCA 2997]|uniref:Uncharacterized protein n=1 Tax=Moniliophthora roreri (strain MCA 2997) TaxID=1381753 RepID=V2W6X4_MONRO|nr:hypothetical protein Moror_3687 [Moniliophthora roreri MCA 2997]